MERSGFSFQAIYLLQEEGTSIDLSHPYRPNAKGMIQSSLAAQPSSEPSSIARESLIGVAEIAEVND